MYVPNLILLNFTTALLGRPDSSIDDTFPDNWLTDEGPRHGEVIHLALFGGIGCNFQVIPELEGQEEHRVEATD
jgi:hypothetical protein